MSTPVRGLEARGALKYAPKWAQEAAPQPPQEADQEADPDEAELSAYEDEPEVPHLDRSAPPPAMPPPPWMRKKAQQGEFEGDVAIVALRARLALAPDQIPEPVADVRPRRRFVALRRLLGLGGLSALAVLAWFGFQNLPAWSPERVAPSLSLAGLGPANFNPGAATAYQKAGRHLAQLLPVERAAFPVQDGRRDLTTGSAGGPPEEPIAVPFAATPLSRPGGSDGAAAVAPGARPSATHAALMTIDPEEAAALLARARSYISAGDVSAARLVLRRAAEGGDGQAALLLGGTYDPNVLKRLRITTTLADPSQARGWYLKAADLGASEAAQRIEVLAKAER